MIQKTIILPTSRSIREKILQNEDNNFLDNYLTIAEFFKKVLHVKKLKFIDDDTRDIFLLKASNFESFAKLQIERNFFSFTKNSSYIFSFFEELSQEKVSLDEILVKDFYGEYEEHIQILKELYKRYKEVCLENNMVDKIFLPEVYSLNLGYIKRIKDIEFYLDGMLSRFELEILQKLCKYINITIIFETTKFNIKMRKRFEEIGINFDDYAKYHISLNKKEILSKTKPKKFTKIYFNSVSEKLLQIGYVKHKISYFIQKGYKPNKIAVVLPDEKTKEFLELFDNKNNFNFAMGKDYSSTQLYKKIDAIVKMCENSIKENEAYMQRIGEKYYLDIYTNYKKNLKEINVIEILSKFCEDEIDTQAIEIYKNELYKFEKILPYLQELNLKGALNLFLKRLSKNKIDDVGGGKITVLGVLETRGMEFDGVIVLDFNESNVPKKLDKDMFLNSKIRSMTNLPTTFDRESLQKHYYFSLFNNSKEVCISYVKSASDIKSKFLKEINTIDEDLDENLFSKYLFNFNQKNVDKQKEIIFEYDFTKSYLSNEKLKIFLTCKKKFYLKYIQNISNFEIPKDIPDEWEIGKSIHLALKNLYTKKNYYSSFDELKKDLEYELDNQKGFSELEKFQISLYKMLLSKFCYNEIKRFSKGYKVAFVEQEVKTDCDGFKLRGIIDRIDEIDKKYSVLDYKTGSIKTYTKNSIEDAKDFQLEFYYLLASNLGEIKEVGFYDLQNAEIVYEKFFQEKLIKLQDIFSSLRGLKSYEASMCEEISQCRFCEYKIMCGRE